MQRSLLAVFVLILLMQWPLSSSHAKRPTLCAVLISCALPLLSSCSPPSLDEASSSQVCERHSDISHPLQTGEDWQKLGLLLKREESVINDRDPVPARAGARRGVVALTFHKARVANNGLEITIPLYDSDESQSIVFAQGRVREQKCIGGDERIRYQLKTANFDSDPNKLSEGTEAYAAVLEVGTDSTLIVYRRIVVTNWRGRKYWLPLISLNAPPFINL